MTEQKVSRIAASARLLALATVLAGLSMASTAFAGPPGVVLSPVSGHPKSNTNVSGSGFSASQAIDIYFDTTDMMLVVSDSSGAFPKHALKVPAGAEPGTHWITAIERSDGKAAQASFIVRTAWAEVGFSPRGKRNNPYENVIATGNVATLDTAWTATTLNIVSSSPAVVNGLVYVGSADSKFYAFNAITGKVKWAVDVGSRVECSAAVVNGVVYVGSDNGLLYAFNASTGVVKWTASTGSANYSSPAVADGVVYVGSFFGNLNAFNATTGEPLWSTPTGGTISTSAPAVANGMVYVGALDKNCMPLVPILVPHCGRRPPTAKCALLPQSPAAWSTSVLRMATSMPSMPVPVVCCGMPQPMGGYPHPHRRSPTAWCMSAPITAISMPSMPVPAPLYGRHTQAHS